MEIVKELFEKKNLRYWFYILLGSLTTGLWNFGIITTTHLIYNEELHTAYYFLDEITGSLSGYVMLPAIFWIFYKYPIKKNLLLTRIPIHILTSIIYGVCGTIFMTLSRTVLYDIFKMGEYDPGNLFYRFIMEYHKQLFWYWIIYAGIYILNSFRESQKQKLRTSELQQQLTRARLQALQSQLNPHFLFNTLNMISSIMYKEPKTADRMIANLSDLMRITLRNTDEVHSLKSELELTELYLEIMKARFQNKLFVNYAVDESAKTALVPWFILQPILENSIKHSMDFQDEGKINITGSVIDNVLKLTITDNGPGINESTEALSKKGVGLSNTIERLEKLYGKNYQFELGNMENDGLRVTVVVPFQISKET